MKRSCETWVMTAVVVSCLALAGCASKQEDAEAEAGIPVRTAEVSYEEVSVPIHASGKLAAAAESRLSFKVGGIIGRIAVEEGEAVAGDLMLAELKMDEIAAQVAQARSAFEKARRDLERLRRLYADSAATLEQLQDAETGFTFARSSLEIAEFNQDHAAIYAPGEGRVLKRFVEAGELVGPGTPFFLFGSTGKGWTVRVGVTDRNIIRLQRGDSASVSFDAYPHERFPASVVEIGEVADPLSGAYEVELRIAPGRSKLVSGFVASVEILPIKCDPMYVIPIEAVMEADDGDAYVYVPDASGTTARRVPVGIGCMIGERMAVRSGLDGVAEVITDGAAYLTDNSAIRIVE
jgi:multidrug efflux system membrane fusion protein